MNHVTFTDLRNNLATHLDRVEQDRAELVVTRQNHEPVVIVPLADWVGMKEDALRPKFAGERQAAEGGHR